MGCSEAGGTVAFAQAADPIIIEHADTWRGAGVDKQFDLIGHVRILHGETALTSDRVRYFRVEGRMLLEGRVEVRQPNGILRADRMEYREALRELVADGAVAVIDSGAGTTLTGTHGKYDQRSRLAVVTGCPKLVRKRENDEIVIVGKRFEYILAEQDSAKRAIAQDSVTVIDGAERIIVTCQRAVYTRAPERAVLTGQPRLVKHGVESDTPLVVTGVRMDYRFAEKRAEVVDSVRVTRGGIYGVCDTVAYFSEDNRSRLTGNPVLREGNSELRGDEIVLHLEDDTVTEAVITGNAFGAYAPYDTVHAQPPGERGKKSTIRGRSLHVRFEAETVREITASHNAVSTYHPSAGLTTGPQGPNEVSANRITLILDHGRLVRVIAEGSVIGTYEPPRDAARTP